MKSSSEYRAMARETLNGRWAEMAVLAFAILVVSSIGNFPNMLGAILHSTVLRAIGSAFNMIVAVFAIIPLWLAFEILLLSCARRVETTETYFSELWRNLKTHWDTFVLAGVLISLIMGIASVFFGILFGVSIAIDKVALMIIISTPLLIAWVIIISLLYNFVPFIIQDNPGITASDALHASRMMMEGHMWQLFVLKLTFIGWVILGILTLFMGFLLITPYKYTATAHFYEDVKAEYDAKIANGEAI